MKIIEIFIFVSQGDPRIFCRDQDELGEFQERKRATASLILNRRTRHFQH